MLDSIIGFIIGIVITVIGYTISAIRPGYSAIRSKPSRLQSFTTEVNPKETMKAIVRFAQQTGYKISFIDETKGQLVLEKSASAVSWGFFFPVFVSQQSDNTTLVEIGIESKFFQYGPLVSRSHEKCVNGIKAALLLAQGRN